MAKESWAEREAEILARLADKADADPSFTPDEVKVLRELIAAFRGWRAFGRGVKVIVVALGLVAAGLTAYDAIMDRVRAWLTGG